MCPLNVREHKMYDWQLRSDERARRGLHAYLLLDYAGCYSIFDDYCCAYLLILHLRGRMLQIGTLEAKGAVELRFWLRYVMLHTTPTQLSASWTTRPRYASDASAPAGNHRSFMIPCNYRFPLLQPSIYARSWEVSNRA
jgi:hypothetical protein